MVARGTLLLLPALLRVLAGPSSLALLPNAPPRRDTRPRLGSVACETVAGEGDADNVEEREVLLPRGSVSLGCALPLRLGFLLPAEAVVAPPRMPPPREVWGGSGGDGGTAADAEGLWSLLLGLLPPPPLELIFSCLVRL